MNLKYKLYVIFYFWILFTSQLYALENKVLYKVNNKIITSFDILNEAKYLNVLNKEFKNFNDLKIYEIASNSLIREKIKENELKKIYKDIDLEKKFLEDFLINYFKRYNLNSIGEVEKFLNQNDLKLDDIKKKLKIQLMWNELIFKKFSNNIKIDKGLIKKELSKKKVQKEFLISEIVFNVSNKNELDEKLKLIQSEIKQSSFSRAAIIYSESETSINGGDIGWVKENSLSDKIKKKIKMTKIGGITKPIQIPGAFIVLKVEDKRETEIKLDFDEEVESIIKKKTNEQLSQFSNIYFNKIKKNIKIDEL